MIGEVRQIGRMSNSDWAEVQQAARAAGYKSASKWCRKVLLEAARKAPQPPAKKLFVKEKPAWLD